MTNDDFTALLDAASADRRDQATASLARIVLLEGQRRAIEQELNILKGRVKEVLEETRDPLVDGERGISATLINRNKPAMIDLRAVADGPRGEEYLADAARALVLTAALTPLRALKGRGAWADALLAAEVPGGITTVLVVEETQ